MALMENCEAGVEQNCSFGWEIQFYKAAIIVTRRMRKICPLHTISQESSEATEKMIDKDSNVSFVSTGIELVDTKVPKIYSGKNNLMASLKGMPSCEL
ncbi:hypothetical protein SDJN02_05391, partial [Cucurbita argyrosperma subsp. argyrosperma]